MSNRLAGGIKAGATSVSLPVLLRKTADSTELTGVAFGSVTASYRRQGAATVAITAASLAAITTAWTSGGWIEADASSQPGAYRLDVPDAAFVAGVDWVIVAVKAAGAFVFYERFNLETQGAAEVFAQIGANGAGLTSVVAASVTGPVGSVTGNVGGNVVGTVASVTGNVGGNVVGSVGSVTGSVGSVAGAISSVGSVTGSVGSVAGDVAGKLLGGGTGTIAGVGASVNTTQVGGQPATLAAFVTSKLTSDGLDAVQVEAGVNARQALSPILAAAAGVISGQGTGTVTIKAGNNPTVTRVTATTDSANNRPSVTLTIPA